MGDVVTLHGLPYRCPHYRDRRGRSVTFSASVRDESKPQGVNVTGYETVFGLLLHRPPVVVEGSPSRLIGWSISEPETGCRVAHSDTRQGALAELVAFRGGAT